MAHNLIADSVEAIHPLLIGSIIPDITIFNLYGNTIKLKELVYAKTDSPDLLPRGVSVLQ